MIDGMLVNVPSFQHTAARRRLAVWLFLFFKTCRFNTQPPEGGWELSAEFEEVMACFNTQPPEGGWILEGFNGHDV